MDHKGTNGEDPPEDLEEPLYKQTKVIQRAGLLVVGVQSFLIILLIAGIVVLALKVSHDETANRDSQCFFYSTIGGIPLPAKPAPTKRNVEIIASARIAFKGLGCSINIDPPNSVLINAAKKFGVPLAR